MTDLWYPAALQEHGPWGKRNNPGGGGRGGDGVVIHSAEGSLESTLATLRGPKEASWHFTVAKAGTVFQHYELHDQCWHAGPRANPYYVGIECEGRAGEGLTELQLAALAALVRWIADQDGWPLFERGVSLFEHNEFMATSCPSGRIPWDLLIPMIEAAPSGDEAPPDDFPLPPDTSPPAAPPPSVEAQLRGLVAAAFVVSVGNPLSDLSLDDRAAVRFVADQL